MLPNLDTIIENFEILDDPMDRYEYVIELGKTLPALPAERHVEANRVHGCESQVWLDVSLDRAADAPRLALAGDSDSHIVKGFVALMVALYSGRTPEEALKADGFDLLKRLEFGAHITSKRSNGVRSMVERIHRDAGRLAAA
ncbi:cysteine desulfuration protein SufE [Methylorubrum rhodinum]|uniref:Cysteine desulfuration protein SufE n=1 Tax=Methylorubrum rhodinum TaxID=29428 RepID=A0A840ZGQ5_9HYPH|nr:SufE family protein [Methylorubrum rhodinum]MBB5756989.1 cysteine desulfuration protein SufE [Methylorubrum rhodinum]